MPKPEGLPGSYDVGYGKPPEHTRFKKGTSGNPKGRRPSNMTLDEHIQKLLSTNITNSSGKRVSVREGIVTISVLALLDPNKSPKESRERLELLQKLDEAAFNATAHDLELLDRAAAAFQYRASKQD